MPLSSIELRGVDEVDSDVRRIVGFNVSDGGNGISASFLVDSDERMCELLLVGELQRRKVRAVTFRDVADLAKDGDGTTNDAMRLRVTNGPISTLKRPGSSLGMKGRTVISESTSFAMLSTMLWTCI